MVEPIKIVRKWTDVSKRFQYGQDINGNLYCRDLKEGTNLTLTDRCFQQKGKFYYRFVNPKTNKVKLVAR